MVLNSDDFVTCLITSCYQPIFLVLKKFKSFIIVYRGAMINAAIFIIIHFNDLF